ncbi:hypothetical protein ACFOY4_01810 [Actinomadura syzygii]|nr:hypothetical protein [Actinomadura syzygii]
MVAARPWAGAVVGGQIGQACLHGVLVGAVGEAAVSALGGAAVADP